jgi:hypothetical protein
MVLKNIWSESKSYGLTVSPIKVIPKKLQPESFAAYKTFISNDVDKSLLVNFEMLPGMFKDALKKFPSTYNPVLGGHMKEYETNRSKFLEDIASGAKKI